MWFLIFILKMNFWISRLEVTDDIFRHRKSSNLIRWQMNRIRWISKFENSKEIGEFLLWDIRNFRMPERSSNYDAFYLKNYADKLNLRDNSWETDWNIWKISKGCKIEFRDWFGNCFREIGPGKLASEIPPLNKRQDQSVFDPLVRQNFDPDRIIMVGGPLCTNVRDNEYFCERWSYYRLFWVYLRYLPMEYRVHLGPLPMTSIMENFISIWTAAEDHAHQRDVKVQSVQTLAEDRL